jgi:hypothetical protein
MRISILSVLAAATFLAAQPADGQQAEPSADGGSVSGTVVSEGSGAPLTAATVTIRWAADSTIVAATLTRNGGRFLRVGIPTGTYIVEISSLGHVTAVRGDVRITADQRTTDLGTVALRAEAIALEGVTAEGERSAVTYAVDRSIYNIREMPAVQGGFATDALRAIPELEVDVDDNIRARGGEPQIFLDDRPLSLQGAARTEFLQSLRADRIERIEYIPNPSARYEADGQSGIVNIVLRRDARLGLSGSVAANAGTRGTQGLSSRLNYQIGSLTFFGGGTLNFSQSNTSTFDLRQNLVSEPVTYLEQNADRRRDGISGGGDITAELKLSDRSTVWAIGRGNRGGSDEDALSEFIHRDADRVTTDRYVRENATDSRSDRFSSALGYRRVVESQRDEFSAELRYNGNGSDASTRNAHRPLTLDGGGTDVAPGMTSVGSASDDALWAFQADLSKPIAAATRIEVGYRGNFRGNENRQEGEVYVPDSGSTTTFLDRFRYTEDSHATYVNLDHRIGKLSLQAGLRAEQVDGRVVASNLNEPIVTEHRGFFPSANLSYDLGGGRQLRVSYSNRIERPNSGNLNPIDTTPTDPYTRTVGNPGLTPADLHMFSVDASWTGTIGTLRASPHVYRGSDLWDRIRTVDETGVLTTTPRNIASAGLEGLSLNGSIRQFGPFSGNIGFNVRHLAYEVGDLDGVRSDEFTTWNVNANVTATVTPTLRIQTTGTYSPGDLSPQGRRSAFRQANIAITQRVYEDRGTVTLSIVDPFDLSRTTFTSQNEGHQQTGRTNNRIRRATLSFSYNFGRPPQSNRRVVTDEPSGGGGLGGE